MANPTTNFGWVMPTSTDLVTDLPADFNVFGQGVDTTMMDLKGGTTGQILSKATNTDMDFTWIANDQGDITGVTATSPLTGGGTSGAITVGIQDATTSVKGAVQLSDSTSTTSSILAATPTAVKAAYDKASTAATTSVAGIVQLSDSTSTTSSVLASTPTATKSAYDLANAAIPKSTVTTAGDLIVATGSSAVTRLAIGANNTYLKSNGTTASWAAVSGGFTLISATAVSAAATINIDGCFTTTYDNYRIIFAGNTNTGDTAASYWNMILKFRTSGTTNSAASYNYNVTRFFSASTTAQNANSQNGTAGFEIGGAFNGAMTSIDVYQPQIAQYTTLTNFANGGQITGGFNRSQSNFMQGFFNNTTQFDGFSVTFAGATQMTGTWYVYGYAKS
jgi:hypothetical protein